MAIDPFADLTPAATDDESPVIVEEPTEPKKETKPVTVTTPTENKIVTTLKAGAGYDAPWIVIHSDTLAEANQMVHDPELKELMDQVKKVGAYFSKGSAPAPANNGKPAGATQAPGGETPPEGYVFKSGVGKNGKPWKAFMPIDRNSGLEVIWLR